MAAERKVIPSVFQSSKSQYNLRSSAAAPLSSRVFPVVELSRDTADGTWNYRLQMVIEGNTLLAKLAKNPWEAEWQLPGTCGYAGISGDTDGGFYIGSLRTRLRTDEKFAIAVASMATPGEKQMIASLGHAMLCFSIDFLITRKIATLKSQFYLYPFGRMVRHKQDLSRLVEYYKSIGFKPTDRLMSATSDEILQACSKAKTMFPTQSATLLNTKF